MKRRTFISLMGVMAAAGVLSMTGCSSKDTAASTASSATLNKLDSIQKSGKLVVALEGAWQPWSYHDSSDTLVGYDVEVSRAIAEKLGVEPEYVESDWDSLFAGLDAGRYDMVCNGVEVTEERAKTYAFTTPYGYIHTALAVRKDNTDIHSFEDLKGKTTANSLASTYMELAESYGATVQGIDTLEETIQLLTAGRIDATLNADVSFYDYLNVHPDADFKLVAQTAESSHVAIPVLKSEDTAYLDALNKTFKTSFKNDDAIRALAVSHVAENSGADSLTGEMLWKTEGDGKTMVRQVMLCWELKKDTGKGYVPLFYQAADTQTITANRFNVQVLLSTVNKELENADKNGITLELTALGVGAKTIGGKTYVAIGFELTNTTAQ